MLKIVIDTQNLAKMENNVRQLQSDWPTLFRDECWKIGTEAQLYAIEVVPRKTGHLASTIHVEEHGKYGFRIFEGADYGKYLRSGVKPRPIEPRVKKALYWKGLPHPVAWAPNWPGIRPIRYDEKIADWIRKHANTTFRELGSRLRVYLGRGLGG